MVSNILSHIKTLLYYKWIFGKFDNTALLIKPLKIDNPKSIFVGKKTYIGHFAWLMGSSSGEKTTLNIGDYVQIGHFSHIVALDNVKLENSVLLADHVFISDCTHRYENTQVPVLEQGVKILTPVIIGEGSWLGENVCVCGASIGKHCVIGANSVVIKDIPDYCVAVGSPAKVIKRYNFDNGMWETC